MKTNTNYFVACLLLFFICHAFSASVRGQDEPEKTQREKLNEKITRAYQAERAGRYTVAIECYSEILKEYPEGVGIWEHRGDAHFMAGEIGKAISDYDAAIRLQPTLGPYKWQRGLALYYAEKFSAGIEQFESHQTVNRADVENAVWHFLCVAQHQDFAAAQEKLIPIRGDSRVPMSEVHALFSGQGTVEQVESAMNAVPGDAWNSRVAKYYGNLYLGLYFEAAGDVEKSKAYIAKAADVAPEEHNVLMFQIARLHRDQRKKETP